MGIVLDFSLPTIVDFPEDVFTFIKGLTVNLSQNNIDQDMAVSLLKTMENYD